MRTNYGSIVDGYMNYATNQELPEWILGHKPIIQALEPLSGKTILDLGCGPANFSSVLTEQGAVIIGYDADPTVIENARRNDPKGDYRVNRGLIAQDLNGKQVDEIIATFSICVIPNRELRYILRDLREVLKPGGRFLILEPNQLGSGIKYAKLHYHHKKNVRTGDLVSVTLGSGESTCELTDDIYRTHADYRQLLEEAGFTIDQFEEPRPDPSWEGDWELEAKYPPFLLIVAH
ncbi:MAG: class I SAM-dependent methyltransferase [Candidatus Berkelbacteria bacterium]|nr:class I SAM-dependent methyltransferase [Candidatus Berkelbacteria bacterium]